MTRTVDDPARRIERYLLGRLSAEEQQQMEARLFEDDELLPLIQDAEEQLIDRYLAGDLSPEDRDAFEQHFAASRWRQDRVAFRRILPAALASDASSPAASPFAFAPDAARVLRRPWVAAAMGLAAVVVLALVWVLGFRQPARSSAPPTAVVRTPPPESRPTEPPAGDPPAAGSGVQASRGPDPSFSAPFSKPQASLILRGGILRAPGAMARLAAQASGEIRLEAVLDKPGTPGLGRAVVRRVEGETIWEGPADVSQGGRRALIAVPAALLSPGDYVLSVMPRGTALDDAPAYVFRVVPSQVDRPD